MEEKEKEGREEKECEYKWSDLLEFNMSGLMSVLEVEEEGNEY